MPMDQDDQAAREAMRATRQAARQAEIAARQAARRAERQAERLLRLAVPGQVDEPSLEALAAALAKPAPAPAARPTSAPTLTPAPTPALGPRPLAGGFFTPCAGGVRYINFIPHLARELAVESYFEIGTSTGKSLVDIHCLTVSVDPHYRLAHDVIGRKPALLAFQETSDDFFARRQLAALLPKGKVELAFLDGMHHFEFLLRDFMHTEKACDAQSLLVMHDCLPSHPNAARRRDRRGLAQDTSRNVRVEGSGWTGDVWKTLRILQEWRQDLRITILNCPPTGLVAITGCDPTNRVLEQNYDRIVAEWMDADLKPGWFDALHDTVTLTPTRDLKTPAEIRAALGLPL